MAGDPIRHAEVVAVPAWAAIGRLDQRQRIDFYVAGDEAAKPIG
jgi:hypothetical protein